MPDLANAQNALTAAQALSQSQVQSPLLGGKHEQHVLPKTELHIVP